MLKNLLFTALFAFLAGAAYGQFPATGNKSRLGWQTTGDGLIYRGTLADTGTVKPTGLNNAYFLLDTVNAVLYRYIKTQGGWQRAQAEGDLLHVLEGGANSAGLSISGELVNDVAFLVVDGNNATPWDGLRVVGYFSQRVRDEVTIQGSGLITITETTATAGGTITIDASIPPNYITSNLLSQGVRDSLATDVTIEQGGQISATIVVDGNNATPWDGLRVVGITETIGTEGEVVLTIDGQTVTFQIGSNLSFPDTTAIITLENNQGTDVYFAPGENIALSSAGDTMTIAAPLSLSVSQGTLGPAFVVVDNNTALPCDGSNVIGYFATQTIGVTLQLNNESVTFYPVQDGNKTDITVTGNGEVWNLNNGVVDWATLNQDVKDSIEARLINPVDSLQFITTYEGSAATFSKLIWNTQSGTLHLDMTGAIEMPLGQGEAHMVRNVTGSQIAKGKVVYISGATGQRPQISLADADAEMSSSGTFGITAEAIDNNDTGFVFTSGYIKGINTSTLIEGEALWLDTVPGNFTHDKPTAPVHAVLVGYVITKKNNGTIFVKIQNGYELGELHDVSTQGKAAQDILRYNGTIWQPGKDTSLYNMDARLKGNRLVSMGTADLQFRQAAGAPDYVQIKKDFVLVGNTNTGYNTVIDQYGIKQDEAGGNDAQIYMTSGEIALHGNQSVDGGLDPDLVVKPNGRIEFRVSAPGPADSLFGKNSNGELTAVDFNFLSPVDTVSLSNRINLKLNISDTTAMLSTYLKKADTLSLSNRINTKQNTLTNSAGLAAALNDETGTGVAVFNDAPSFNTSITVNGNGVISRAPAASAITHIAVFAADPLNTARSIATRTPTQLRGDIGAQSTLTNSAGLAAALSDEVGNGAAVFNTNATMKQTLIVDNDSTSSISFGGWLSLKFNNQNRWNIAVQTPFVNNDLYFNDVANSRTPLALSRTNGFVGINEVSPSRQLHVTGEARITDLTTDTPTRIVGADADGDLGAATIGAGLEIVSGELKQKILTASDSLDFGSLGAWSSELKTITLTNAALSDPVTLGIPNSSSASVNVVFTAYVSAADTVTVKATNAGSTTVDPGKGLFKIIVHKY